MLSFVGSKRPRQPCKYHGYWESKRLKLDQRHFILKKTPWQVTVLWYPEFRGMLGYHNMNNDLSWAQTAWWFLGKLGGANLESQRWVMIHQKATLAVQEMCVCLGRGDAKQFSAKTRKPENGQENAKTRKPREPRKRENRENAETAKTAPLYNDIWRRL